MNNELWDRQRIFTQRVLIRLGKPIEELTLEEKIDWTKQYILAMHAEADEALQCLPWKKHRRSSDTIANRGNLIIELIDVQKYLWGLMQIWGVSPEEFEHVFQDKSFEVEHRWIQEHELENIEELQNAAIIDIDGVLNYYPQCFYEWILQAYGEAEIDTISEDRARYELLKDEYRNSGAKRLIKVRPDSRDALRSLKRKNIPIILLTDRPYTRIKRVSFDTMAWLEDNEVQYDYLFWSYGQSKTHIAKKVKSIAFVVDDKVKTCEEFMSIGIRSYLLTTSGNYYAKGREGLNCISTMYQIPEVKNG
jgi:hypothetical protein